MNNIEKNWGVFRKAAVEKLPKHFQTYPNNMLEAQKKTIWTTSYIPKPSVPGIVFDCHFLHCDT